MSQCKNIGCRRHVRTPDDFCVTCVTSAVVPLELNEGASGPFHEISGETGTGLTAPQLLQAAAGHMEDRASTYDAPSGERSMAKTVTAFNALTGQQLTETQGWTFMALLKIARANQGAFKLDNYEDLVAYSALAGEAAIQETEET